MKGREDKNLRINRLSKAEDGVFREMKRRFLGIGFFRSEGCVFQPTYLPCRYLKKNLSTRSI